MSTRLIFTTAISILFALFLLAITACSSEDSGDDASSADDDSFNDDDTGPADDDTSADDTTDDDAADDSADDDADDSTDDTADDSADDDDDTGDDDTVYDDCPEVPGILIDPEVVEISPGVFLMGSPDEELGRDIWEMRHQVTMTKTYYMMKYEVTQPLWKAVMGTIPAGQWECGADYPIGAIPWVEAVVFANGLSEALGYDPCYSNFEGPVQWDMECDGYRLPTEAEWEYAARAGTETAFFNGDITDYNCDDPNLDQIAWYCGTSGYHIQKVGLMPANPWGLHDILGNIWEWAWDGFDNEDQVLFTADPVTDPTGPGGSVARVYRGGGMFSIAADVRAAKRRFDRPDYTDGDTALRLVRSAVVRGPDDGDKTRH